MVLGEYTLALLLPPAYEVRGKVMFILGNICLSTVGEGGIPSPFHNTFTSTGPISFLRGVPHLHLHGPVPISGEVPHPGLNGKIFAVVLSTFKSSFHLSFELRLFLMQMVFQILCNTWLKGLLELLSLNKTANLLATGCVK